MKNRGRKWSIRSKCKSVASECNVVARCPVYISVGELGEGNTSNTSEFLKANESNLKVGAKQPPQIGVCWVSDCVIHGASCGGFWRIPGPPFVVVRPGQDGTISQRGPPPILHSNKRFIAAMRNGSRRRNEKPYTLRARTCLIREVTWARDATRGLDVLPTH